VVVFDVRVTVRSATVSTYQRHNFFNRPDVIGDPASIAGVTRAWQTSRNP